MTQEGIIRNCENSLNGNGQDPLYQMMNMLMEMEANIITGSEKGEHNSNRSGTRSRRFDRRLGTFNLQIPKFRNTGYVPYFMQYKQRSEDALISMVVEAYTEFFSKLKARGPEKVRLCVSDAHSGLQAAIENAGQVLYGRDVKFTL